MNTCTRCLLALLVATVAACGPGRPPKVVIGAGMGTNSYPALRLAEREINAAGGIGGVPLELIGLENSQTYSPPAVLAAAARFGSVPYLLGVVGHADSASTLTAAPSYNRAGIPQIVAIATNPAITGIGAWTYRVCLSDASQGRALADYAVKDWQKTRLGIVYVNDDYGRGLAKLFEERARALGATIVATATHHNTLTDDDKETIVDAIADLKKGGATLVVLFQRLLAAAWTVDAIRRSQLDASILGADDLAQAQFPGLITTTGEGIRVSQFVNLDVAQPQVARFAGQILRETGRPADSAQALSYDSVYLLRDAIVAGGYSREGIKDYLDQAIRRGHEFNGVAGKYTLGEDHDARRPLFVAEIRGGVFQVLGPLSGR